MPPANRQNPVRAKSSDSRISFMEFLREFPDDAACLDYLWLARTVPEWSVEMWTRAWLISRGAPPRATDRPNLCLVTLRVVQLVVQALIPLDGTAWQAERGENMRHLRKAWPSTYTPVSWPPAAVLPSGDLDIFAKSFEPPNTKPGDTWEETLGFYY